MRQLNSPNRTGASAVIIIMMFAATLVFALLSINAANIQRHQASNKIAVDLASRWGSDMLSREKNHAKVRRQVQDLVARNWGGEKELKPGWIENNKHDLGIDVEFGSVNMSQHGTFNANHLPFNAARVGVQSTVRLTGFRDASSREIELSAITTAATVERDICLVVDRSRSMNKELATGKYSRDNSSHPDNPLSRSTLKNWRSTSYRWWKFWPHPTQSRWSAMIPAIYQLADELDRTNQKETLSIVSYSTSYNSRIFTHGDRVGYKRYSADAASVESPLTKKYRKAIDRLAHKYKREQPVNGGTNISAGIDEAVKILTGPNSRPNAFKTMIVMTDGKYNRGRKPWLAAEDAAKLGIEVYTVTFSKHADQKAMHNTAEHGNGLHFHAANGESLGKIFKTIANLPTKVFVE